MTVPPSRLWRIGQKASDVVRWFAEHYPKIKRSTIAMHVEFMSVNNPKLKNHPVIKPALFANGAVDERKNSSG